MSSTTRVPVQKKIDMARQTCNYCKESGHRIHQTDEFGIFVKDSKGERILACPVLLKKESAKISGAAQKAHSIEEAFPALPGSSAPLSDYTISVAKGLDGAIREKKKQDWLDRKLAKDMARQIWVERYTSRMEAKHGARWYWLVEKTADDNDLAAYRRGEEDQYVEQMQDEYGSSWYMKVENTNDDTVWAEYFREEERAYISRMLSKHGPRWFYQVRDTEDETDCAAQRRYAAEDEEREKDLRDDMMWDEIYASQEKEEKVAEKERKARRALMTEEEREQEEEDYMEELEDGLWSSTIDDMYRSRLMREDQEREKAEYARNGWSWPTKR